MPFIYSLRIKMKDVQPCFDLASSDIEDLAWVHFYDPTDIGSGFIVIEF